jgi:hypothetical protein
MSHGRDIRRLRVISDRRMRKLIAGAMTDVRYRMTKSGVMFYGENGKTATAHFTHSDHRVYENFAADLRSIGYHQEK